MRGIIWENGWRWIFILVGFLILKARLRKLGGLTSFKEGLATCVVSVGAFRFIHNYPKTSSFLTEDEKAFVRQRLAVDSDATHEERFTWGAALEALKGLNCWLYGLGCYMMALPMYTLSLFLVSHYP